MRYIDETAVEDIALGAAILGTGGGGDPRLGMLIARSAIREHGPVELVDPAEVGDDAFVAPIAMMGAPAVAKEKLPSLHPLRPIVDAFAAAHGRRVTHVMPADIGGIAALIPVAAAAALGLPMVDADMMGRAFPQLPMLLSSIAGVTTSPLVMSDEWGNTVVFRGADDHHTERLARTMCVEMGASALMALAGVRASEMRGVTVHNSVTLAERVGRAVREARRDHHDPTDAALTLIGGTRLFDGKVVDVDVRTAGGFTRLTAIVAGTDAHSGSELIIRSQNEHLVAMIREEGSTQSETLAAVTPDLIMVFDSLSGEPITTEQLRFGARVTVAAAACDPRYRTAAGLAAAGPARFGYDFDYVPVEDLLSAAMSGGALNAQ